MAPSTVYCQVIQNAYPERCPNSCQWQNGLYSKRWVFSFLFSNKIPSSKSWLMKRLSKVISNVKNANIDKHPCRVCGVWWTDSSNKNYLIPKHKIIYQQKIEETKMKMKKTSSCLKHLMDDLLIKKNWWVLDGWPVN